MKSNKTNLKKKIIVVSGSRADFGIMRKFLKKLNTHKKFKLNLVATGSHLIKNYGMTINEIKKNKIKVCKKIFIDQKNETPHNISVSSSIILRQLSKAVMSIKPDFAIIFGDRYEMLISSYLFTLYQVPIVHIGGGELTEGSYDNQFRHSISKMSNLHFVSHHTYKKRLISMGENPKTIFNFGSLSTDNLKKENFLTLKKLSTKYGLNFKRENFLVTFHPLTLDSKQTFRQFKILVNAINQFNKYNFIFTASNADQEGNKINKYINHLVKKHKNFFYIKSFGQKNYFSVLRYVKGVIGNSSSGLTEVPSFKIGTINIGDRQKGRVKSESIIDSKANKNSITLAIKKIISSKFKRKLRKVKNPFAKKNTADKIIRVLIKFNFNKNKKIFYEKNTRK